MPNLLVLGALSDIARAVAHRYAREGYSLTLAARDPQRLEADAADLRIRHNVEVNIAPAFDALAMDGHPAWYAALPVRPDVVLCAFGVLSDQQQAQTDWAAARQMLDVNFTGAVSILEAVAADMEQRGSGIIVGISSVAGDRGRASNYFYGSAKAGFTAYLSGLRNRLAKKGVHVLTVKPGFVRTAMTRNMPLPPVITANPEQIANGIFRAASKRSNTVYLLWMWKYIMLIIKNVPEGIFKKLSL